MDHRPRQTGGAAAPVEQGRNSVSSNDSRPNEPHKAGAREPTNHAGGAKQRRPRVSRACDECRGRKTKCDGRQPCGNCEAFERYCAYNLSQGRLGAAQRNKIVEDRLRRAHAHIRDLQKQLPPSAHIEPEILFAFPPEIKDGEVHKDAGDGDELEESGEELESMMYGNGKITSQGQFPTGAFYGTGSGFAFLDQTKAFFDDLSDGSPTSNHSERGKKDGSIVQSAITRLFDAPLPDWKATENDSSFAHLLPSHKSATELLRIVFDEAYPLFQFVDPEIFQESTDRLYDREPVGYEDSDYLFLPLFYVVMALGMLFSSKAHCAFGCSRAVMQAMRYFIASRQMIDVTRCHHLASLQAIVCFALFLISTARLATAQTYVGLAVSAALKLGLHSTATIEDPFSDHETCMRRRIYWTITKLDVYSSSCLGLPPLSNPLEADMVSPSFIDTVISELKSGAASDESFTQMCAARHLELLVITARINKTMYQDSNEGFSKSSKSKLQSTKVGRAKIQKVESELQEWRQRTAELFEHKSDSAKAKIIRYDLELADGFCRLILYRPFLHHLADFRHDKPAHQHQLRLAYSCLHVAQEVIYKSEPMLLDGYLGPASWHSMYTIFMAVIAMMFYLACHKDDGHVGKVHSAVEIGIQLLASTTCHDTGSEKCLDVIRALSERLQSRVHIDVDRIRANAHDSAHNFHRKDSQEQQSQTGHDVDMQEHRPQQQQDYSAQYREYAKQQRNYHQQQQSEVMSNPSRGMPTYQDSIYHQQSGNMYGPYHQAMTTSVFQDGGVGHDPIGVYADMLSLGIETDATLQFQNIDAMSMPFTETFAMPMGNGYTSQGSGGNGPGSMSSNGNDGQSNSGGGGGGGGRGNSMLMPSNAFPIAMEDIEEFFF